MRSSTSTSATIPIAWPDPQRLVHHRVHLRACARIGEHRLNRHAAQHADRIEPAVVDELQPDRGANVRIDLRREPARRKASASASTRGFDTAARVAEDVAQPAALPYVPGATMLARNVDDAADHAFVGEELADRAAGIDARERRLAHVPERRPFCIVTMLAALSANGSSCARNAGH